MLEKTGFADVNYLVSENRISGGRSANKMELTFNGPRRGVWLHGSQGGAMGGLDFVSGNAAMAGDLMLKDPTRFLTTYERSGENAFATLPQMEAQLNVKLKDDLSSKLGGEIALKCTRRRRWFPEMAQRKPHAAGARSK